MCRLFKLDKHAAAGISAIAVLALTLSATSAESLVVVSLAGEAFDGPPTFEVIAAGKVVGSGALTKAVATETDGRLFTKPRPSQFLEQFSFLVPDASVLPGKEIAIILTNDKFMEGTGKGEILDRNLFVDFVSVNGMEVTSAELALVRAGEEQHLDYQAGLLPIYEAGYRAIAKPPADGWPVSSQPMSVTPVSAASPGTVPLVASSGER